MLKVLDSAVPVACWSCSVAHNDATLFCPHCSKIQPPPGGDYFSVFGLTPSLDLDLASLETSFTASAANSIPTALPVRRKMKSSGAWPTPRCSTTPIARSKILSTARSTCSSCTARRLAKSSSGKDRKGQTDPSRVPADLLEEVFELNMQLEEMRMARKTGETDPELQVSLEQAQRKFEGLLDDVDRDLRAQWEAWDEGDTEARRAAQNTMVACSTGAATSAIWSAT